jgi:hypothetical protein
MIIYLELENCHIVGTDLCDYIRFGKYNWYQIMGKRVTPCLGSLCRILEQKFKRSI